MIKIILKATIGIILVLFFLKWLGVFILDVAIELIESGEDSQCQEKGLVWDYDRKVCDPDCLTFIKGKGCISLKVLEEIDKEVCGGKKCTWAQELTKAKKECEIYQGAVELKSAYCSHGFQLKECGKLKGFWIYPKECYSNQESSVSEQKKSAKEKCAEKGLVWDEDEKRCRDDCLTWVKGKGCIPLETVWQMNEEVCGELMCSLNEEMEATWRLCEMYQGALNVKDKMCNYDFQMEECFKYRGEWIYPKECYLREAMMEYEEVQRKTCQKAGLTWDYNEKRCRSDCREWIEGKGCITSKVYNR